MLKVTVELVSAVDSSRSRVLGVAVIENDGIESIETNGDTGSYRARFSKWAPKERETWKRGTVSGFNRKTRGAWDLLYLALQSAVGSRNR